MISVEEQVARLEYLSSASCASRAAAAQLRQRKPADELVLSLRINDAGIAIDIDGDGVSRTAGCSRERDTPALMTLTVAARLTRSGRVMRLMHEDEPNTPPDRSIVGLLVRAHGWWNELRTG